MDFDVYWKDNWTPTATMPQVFDMAMREMAERAWTAATAAEREQCAKFAEGATAYTQFQTVEHYKMAAFIAAAIRERSNANVCGLPHGKDSK